METAKIAAAFISSGFLTLILTWRLIPFLKRLKGETIREDVPERHRLKAGTPSMGGWAFVIAVPVVALALKPSWTTLLCSGAMVSFALLGFTDDWAKLKKHKGWRTQPKLAAQILLALLWVGLAWRQLDIGKLGIGHWLWFAFAFLLLLATVNGVNIADGLDGLASGLTAIASAAVGLVSWHRSQTDAALFALVLCGGCISFLPFNLYPAKVFMGDVGSMALGAGLGMAALLGNATLPFLLVGLVFWIEQATVVSQVAYFKWTKRRYGEGRRIFPMTPIHHTFELLGWHEPVIVTVFWLAGVASAVLGLIATILL